MAATTACTGDAGWVVFAPGRSVMGARMPWGALRHGAGPTSPPDTATIATSSSSSRNRAKTSKVDGLGLGVVRHFGRGAYASVRLGPNAAREAKSNMA